MKLLTPTDSSIKLDYSQRDTASQCLRKFFLQYLLDLRSDYGSTSLRYGSAWHKTMEAFYGHIKEHGWTRDGAAISAGADAGTKSFEADTKKHYLWYDDYRTLPNLMLSFTQYINHFVEDEGHLKVIEVEKPFKLPISLTESEHKRFPYLQPFWFTGIIDMEIFYDGRYWQLDHKTTGQSISIQKARLNRSCQSIGYTYAAKQVYQEMPEGHFITIHHLKATKSKVTGDFGKPSIDFSRVPMIYSEDDILAWRDGFLEEAQRIQLAFHNDAFPCSHGSCYTYGTCTYSSICDLFLSENELRERNENQGFEGFFKGEHWDPAKDL